MTDINVDPIEADSVERFEPINHDRLKIWNGRTVSVFPCDRRYESAAPWKNPWRSEGGSVSKWVVTNCGVCDAGLVDYFYECKKFQIGPPSLDMGENVGLIFHRTCVNCCYNDDNKKILRAKSFLAEE